MYLKILKMNLHHDDKGLFASADGFSSGRAIPLTLSGRKWVNSDGSALSPEVTGKMASLSQPIPPNWTKVSIDVQSNAKVVSGVDAKGRPTAVYTKEFHANSDAVKHERVERLDSHVSKVQRAAVKAMMDPTKSARERDDAATVYLISRTAFRPGSAKDTKADTKAFGASTLQKEHVSLDGNKITFKFPSKSGQVTSKTLVDAKLASYLSTRLPSLGDSEKVFRSSGASAGAFLKRNSGKEFLIKDLRTWNGTAVAKMEVAKYPVPTTKAELAKVQKAVSVAVSKHLGNTPAIAFKDYINPKVWPPIMVGPVRKADASTQEGDFYSLDDLASAYSGMLRDPNTVLPRNKDLEEAYEPEDEDWDEEDTGPQYPNQPIKPSKTSKTPVTATGLQI